MGMWGNGSRELSRIAQQEVEALPVKGALPGHLNMAGPAITGIQA